VRKSGKTFTQMMGRMKDLGLQDLAKDYKDLSDKVVGHELNRYVPIFGAPPPAMSTPMPMPMPRGLGFSDTPLAMDADSQDEDSSELSGTDGPAESVLEELGDGYLQF
jgi:hypothetical protein